MMRLLLLFWAYLLVFAPLAFGSVHVWAYTLVELGVFFLILLFKKSFYSITGSLRLMNHSCLLF